MSRLKARIVDLIEAFGPISVAEYMSLCLSDPQDGYYTTRKPFGAEGDFITAPEVSQMFGELIGIWIALAWDALGRPLPVSIAEIGPGRGTLMKDALRALRQLQPDLARQADVFLIETSDRLAAIQLETLVSTAANRVRTVEELPRQPMILIGNELFDAIPIRQYVRAQDGWHERMIGLSEEDELAFTIHPAVIPDAELPIAAKAPPGTVVEVAPARVAVMASVAARIVASGGAALFIDYGHLQSAPGDTFQAMRRHDFADPLDAPGEADLTSHVDFAALAAEAGRHGLATHSMTQGDFLVGLGLLERAGRLGAPLDAKGRQRIAGEVERLAGPEQMGNLFKVMAVLPPSLTVAPFSRAD